MSKVALITGSSRGMGKAEAYEFASRGYDYRQFYQAFSQVCIPQ